MLVAIASASCDAWSPHHPDKAIFLRLAGSLSGTFASEWSGGQERPMRASRSAGSSEVSQEGLNPIKGRGEKFDSTRTEEEELARERKKGTQGGVLISPFV